MAQLMTFPHTQAWLRRYGAWFLAITLTVEASAQLATAPAGQTPATSPVADQSSSPAARFAQNIQASELEQHLRIIASDAMEGRETGSAGQKMTADYLVQQFKALGLQPPPGAPDYLQPFALRQASWGEVYVESAGQRYAWLRDFFGYSGTNSDLQLQDAELVFAGYGIDDPQYSDYEGLDVRGKVVLIYAGEPMNSDSVYWLTGGPLRSAWSRDWRKKIGAASDRGAKALLIASEMTAMQLEQRAMVQYISKPRMELGASDKDEPAYCNTLYLTTAMAQSMEGAEQRACEKALEKINKRFEPQSRVLRERVSIGVEKKWSAIPTENVVAMVQGSDLAGEYIAVTSHYDHLGRDETGIYNGADDDGSGTVTLLGLAGALQEAVRQGQGPRRSVLFIAFSGEENGLLGSRYYTDNPLIPLEQTVTNLNIDMVGRVDTQHVNDPFYVYTIGSDFLSSELHAMSEEAAAEHGGMRIDYSYNSTDDPNRYYYRSDHYNFAKNNIPVVFYFNGSHEDYHQTTDTVDKIRFDVMQERARLAFLTLWKVAHAPKRPVVDRSPE
jgi:hypothetical protein